MAQSGNRPNRSLIGALSVRAYKWAFALELPPTKKNCHETPYSNLCVSCAGAFLTENVAATRHVLLISEGFPPDGGGVATSTKRLARGLTQQGMDVTVLTYQRGRTTDLNRAPSIESLDGYNVVRLGPFFKTAGADQDIALNDKHKAFFRRRFVDNAAELFDGELPPPDLIFSMYLLNAGFLATHIASALGVKHIAGVRGNDIGRNLFDPSSLYATRFVLERATAIACVNRHLQTRMLRVFPDLADRSSIINNAIEPADNINRNAERHVLVEEARWPIDALVVCFIGSFREKKGCLEIVEALDDIHARDPHSPVRLLLIAPPLGSTERVLIGERLEHLIQRGIVRHVDTAQRQAVRKLAAAADVLLQPSLEDGMANALLEGMSVGLCPIVSPIFADIVGANDGLVLTRTNRKTIADAIATLSDPSLRARMSIAAQRRSEDFEPTREAAAYAALFEAVRSGNCLPPGFEPAVRT